jgi:hypothetical protein
VELFISGQGPLAGSCEHSDELSCSISVPAQRPFDTEAEV